jgi:hypothetical protein
MCCGIFSAGDVNGDGLSDLIVGAFRVSINGTGTYDGKSYVVFGKNNTNAVDLSSQSNHPSHRH